MREMLALLGFQLPLESSRYRERGASHILIRFRNLSRLNGRAFDEVRRLPTGECVLIIEITSGYRSGNLTPAHEFFHQVQNGYTPFKRPWFYEGTARWSETILGKTVIAPRAPPADKTGLQALWSQSYSAVSVWYGLVERCSRQPTEIKVPEHLYALHYRDGRPVFLDQLVPGHDYIRQVLENLERLGEQITHDQGLIFIAGQRKYSETSDMTRRCGMRCVLPENARALSPREENRCCICQPRLESDLLC